MRKVYLVGRRGPVQAAFTVAELRELMKLPKCKPVLTRSDFAAFEKHVEGWKRESFLVEICATLSGYVTMQPRADSVLVLL